MKKFKNKTRSYWPILSTKRFQKRIKRQRVSLEKANGGMGSNSNECLAVAPTFIDIYKPKNHTAFIAFKKDLEIKARQAAEKLNESKNRRAFLKICFRNTTHITAAAGLLMVATVDYIKAKYPKLEFKVTRPPNRRVGLLMENQNLVDSVLVHIGFYDLIGHGHIKRRCDAKTVTCWSYAYGDDASGEIAAKLIQNLSQFGIKTNKLYRSCFEAVANACEHAYTDKVTRDNPFILKRWWFFVGVLNDKITVLICDLGHGIPKTLEVTQDENMLTKLWNKLKLPSKPTTDCTLIHASTMVKETRTKEVYRGKGGADVKTFVDETEHSSLIIFSNRGTYRYAGQDRPSKAYDNHSSVGGTIIEWTIPYTNSEPK
ncbi:hypothetical protein [Vibrio parahaemolyticus]|uniref:hypothetical protein n=1 Tax=Vibrio parahaemolyticus TaxID=670 RepID=UPI000AFDA67D|nr:hypothetical protein [Vibrio parahaemolyticus]MCG9539941.1 hypothetical protein [Vibrio parahaemolyticus]MDF4327628.1 hypothetical protein [Vibrio parahaemolyticus]